MRLLYVIDSLAGAGSETSLAEMTPYLVSHGIDLHVLPLKEPLDLAFRLQSAGAQVHVPPRHSRRVDFLRHALTTTRRVRPQLVHTTLFDADVTGRTVAAALRLPASTSWVNQRATPPYDRAWHSRERAAQALDRLTSRFAARFHAVSVAVATDVGPRMGVSPDRISVIPRGREAGRLPFKSANARFRVRKELGVSEHAPLVLVVGRQEPQKAQHLVVEAVAELRTQIPDVTLVIAGRDGRATPQFRAAVQRTGVQVRALGHRTDVPDLMAAADVLAFPSLREGSPGTLIEAMAVGLPIVAADITPCREVLGGNASIGHLVRPNDAVHLAQALEQALLDGDDSVRRSQRGRRRFLETYTIDAISERMYQFFYEAAQSRKMTIQRGG